VREHGDKSIVLAVVEPRKRLSAQNNRMEFSATAVAFQTVTPAPSLQSEQPAQVPSIISAPMSAAMFCTHGADCARGAEARSAPSNDPRPATTRRPIRPDSSRLGDLSCGSTTYQDNVTRPTPHSTRKCPVPVHVPLQVSSQTLSGPELAVNGPCFEWCHSRPSSPVSRIPSRPTNPVPSHESRPVPRIPSRPTSPVPSHQFSPVPPVQSRPTSSVPSVRPFRPNLRILPRKPRPVRGRCSRLVPRADSSRSALSDAHRVARNATACLKKRAPISIVPPKRRFAEIEFLRAHKQL